MNVDQLIEAAELSGFKVDDEKELRRVLEYQLEHGQFEFIEHEGKTIGFFGWLANGSMDGTCVSINNMFILGNQKERYNIFKMCKFFKMKYPDIYKLEWHNQKKNEFKTLILKGRKI